MIERKHIARGITTLAGFLSPTECDHQIESGEQTGFEYAKFGGPDKKQTSMPGFRNNFRVLFEDHDLAKEFWARCQQHVPRIVEDHETIGVSERFRYYRYDKGQFFGRHPDGPQRRPNGERSRLTLIVYLNDDYAGGETIFDQATIEPQKGMALIFIHGLMHEGAEVLAGRKYVLRTDIMCSATPFELDDL